MPDLTEAVGFFASLVSFLVLLPQGVKVWGDRRDPAALVHVALPTQVMLLLNSVLWAVYAALTGSFWVGAPVVVNAPITFVTIVVVLRSRGVLRIPRRLWSAGAGRATTAMNGESWMGGAPVGEPQRCSTISPDAVSTLVSVAGG